MKFSALSAALLAIAGGVTAQLTVLVPGGSDLWWVAQSDNVIDWTCHTSPYTNFTVLITNSNPQVLSAPLAFIAQQNNFDCSELITKDRVSMPPATGYVIQLADPFNNTNVYASSQPFEIKALGSAYPASSATPTNVETATGSATGSVAGTQTGTAAAAATSKNSGATSLIAPGSFAAAAVAVLGIVFA